MNGHPGYVNGHINCPCWSSGDFVQVPCQWHNGKDKFPIGAKPVPQEGKKGMKNIWRVSFISLMGDTAAGRCPVDRYLVTESTEATQVKVEAEREFADLLKTHGFYHITKVADDAVIIASRDLLWLAEENTELRRMVHQQARGLSEIRKAVNAAT